MEIRYEIAYRNIKFGILTEIVKAIPYAKTLETDINGWWCFQVIWADSDVISELDHRDDIPYEKISNMLNMNISASEIRKSLGISSNIKRIGSIRFQIFRFGASNSHINLISFRSDSLEHVKTIQKTVEHILKLAGGTSMGQGVWIANTRQLRRISGNLQDSQEIRNAYNGRHKKSIDSKIEEASNSS